MASNDTYRLSMSFLGADGDGVTQAVQQFTNYQAGSDTLSSIFATVVLDFEQLVTESKFTADGVSFWEFFVASLADSNMWDSFMDMADANVDPSVIDAYRDLSTQIYVCGDAEADSQCDMAWTDGNYVLRVGFLNQDTLNTYTVTFDSDGGSAVPSQTYYGESYSTIYLGDLPTPTKDGYTFLGWEVQ